MRQKLCFKFWREREKGRKNKQVCQTNQQSKYVICFKKENHICCPFFNILFRYVQLTVFPKTVLCSVVQAVKGREWLSFIRWAPLEQGSIQTLSLKAAEYTCSHKIMEWGVRIPQRHLGPASYLVLISFILASGH